MGFWSELSKASPFKRAARAKELKFKVITSVISIPPGLQDRAKICSLCRVHIGDEYARSLLPFLVTTKDRSLTFDTSTTGVVVCSSCINTFNIEETYE
jgi:hypothetical protein